MKPLQLVRPLVRDLHPYVPGEQPKIKGLIKLNTNENPYPPSPRVLRAVRAAVDGRLRLYPNPTAERLREKLAWRHRCQPENIIVGNGSDELLAMAVRCFVEPSSEGRVTRVPIQKSGTSEGRVTRVPNQKSGTSEGRVTRVPNQKSGTRITCPSEVVQYFVPSYSLYPVLAAIHGARTNVVPLNADFRLPSLEQLRRLRAWDFHAALTCVTTPNAPSGRGYSTAELETICRAQKGVIILDEAYVDFAEEHAMRLGLKYPHVIVARTFSKGYSLCFQRVGYFVGHPEPIAALQKIRDSYNVNGLGQIAALATLGDLPYYRAVFRRVRQTRGRLSRDLTSLGFDVLPSQTNFILARPPRFSAKAWLKKLRDRKILVRWFDQEGIRDYLRITVGTPAEVEALLGAVRGVL